MEYTLIQKKNICVLSLEGSLLSNMQNNDIIEAISNKIEENCNLFVINFSKLEHMNSSGLNLLITILTKARKAGGEVVLTQIPKSLKNLLVITKLKSVFNVTDKLEDALRQLTIDN